MAPRKTQEEKDAIKATKLAEKEQAKAAKAAQKTEAKAAVNKTDTVPSVKKLTYQGLEVTSSVIRVRHNGHDFIKFRTADSQKFMIGEKDADLIIEA
jgi:hypothetical protein